MRNPHAQQPTSPWAIINSLWHNRRLIFQLTRRDIAMRYRGSLLGVLWSFLIPLFILAIYTFIFSFIFKARWGFDNESKTQFAIILFVGLLLHSLFSEMLNRAPLIVISNANYVKKVVFPLEILPVIILGSSLFNAMVSFFILAAAFFLANGFLHGTTVFVPLVIMPFIVFSLGIGWILAATGVFIRDIGQITGMLATALLFLSAILFPVSVLPASLRPLAYLSPLTFIAEQLRDIFIWGRLPDWEGLLIYTLIAGFVAWLGFYWFQKTRKGFADVI